MIINPKDCRTSSNDRHVLRAALSTYIAAQQNRLDRLKKQDTREQCEDDIARAQDLMTRFSAP